jgi:ASC-1-like (ASCH) protein
MSYFPSMPNFHLVILKKFYLDKILDGSKHIESRLTKSAVLPFGCVARGDTLFLKESCGPVCAIAQVAAVKQFSNLMPAKISALKAGYNHLIVGAESYWKAKSDCKFAVLLWLKNVRSIKPIRIYKKDWRAWVVLKKPNDFGLLDKLVLSKVERLTSSGDIIKQAD